MNQFMDINVSKREREQFMNINVQKDGPSVFRPIVFGSSAVQNGGLSLFNTRPAKPANTLKTKDLRKRHF